MDRKTKVGLGLQLNDSDPPLADIVLFGLARTTVWNRKVFGQKDQSRVIIQLNDPNPPLADIVLFGLGRTTNVGQEGFWTEIPK